MDWENRDLVFEQMTADLKTEVDRVSGGRITISLNVSWKGSTQLFRPLESYRGCILASATYKVRMRHDGLHRHRVLHGKDVLIATDDLIARGHPQKRVSTKLSLDQWEVLTERILAQTKEWNHCWEKRVTTLLERAQRALQAKHSWEWWIDWKLAELNAEVGEVSVEQIGFSWRRLDRFVTRVELLHKGLQARTVIQGRNVFKLAERALFQVEEWNELWEEHLEPEDNRDSDNEEPVGIDDKNVRRARIEAKKAESASRSANAEARLSALQRILVSCLGKGSKVEWEKLTIPVDSFKPIPIAAAIDSVALPVGPPPAPDRNASLYQPPPAPLYKRSFLAPFGKTRLDKDLHRWQQTCARLASQYEADQRAWERKVAEHKSALAKTPKRARELALFETEQATFYAYSNAHNSAVDTLHSQYEARDPKAIVPYCELVLANLAYADPDCFPHAYELDFNTDTGVLLVHFLLPAPQDMPTLKEVKYVQSSDTFTEKHLSESMQVRLYDDVIYQATLRTIRELFHGDYSGIVQSIVFNGFVTSNDKGTGREITACIVSVQATRSTFETINLANVDPKTALGNLRA